MCHSSRSMMSRRVPWGLLVAISMACSSSRGPVVETPTATTAASTPEPVPSATHAPATPAAPAEPECMALGCRLFDTPTQALEHVLASKPLVLGVGEAHALQGMEGVASTTSRFTDQFLPALAAHSSDIVLELMEPDRRCLKTTEKVRQEQKQVTKGQATSNQNEFVTLGTRAKEAGVQPHILYPNCPQYERIVQAGQDSIFVMLETIALLTDQKAKAILARNQKAEQERLVLLYGGAVHNDVNPRQGRETWSYGPSLKEHTQDRYVELDLIVREYIKDSEVWKGLVWYPHFNKQNYADRVVLFNPAPHSFVLIFAASTPTP